MKNTVHILSGGAARAVCEGLADALNQATACAISGRYGAVGAMRDLLLQGAPCDVLILTAALVEELEQSGKVQPGSARPLGKVKTAIAVKAGSPHPVVATPEDLRAALLEASSLWFPDPKRATAGIHFKRVLEELGIFEALRERLRTWPNGATAMAQMAQQGAPGAIGCTQVTEILYTPGVSLVAPLPAEFELATTYVAAVASQAAHPQAAQAMVHLLGGEASRTLRMQGGFE